MVLFFNKRLRIEEDKIIYVNRFIPGKGKILVQVGQEVTPGDILGRGSISGGFRVVDLARQLSVSPKEALKYLARPLNQQIYKGELLAYKKGGLLSSDKTIISPTDGVIHSFDYKTGNLRIEFIQHESNLPAAVFGVVEKIDQLRGHVLIRTQAIIVYGLLGSGKIREGLLVVLDGRSGLIDKNAISKGFAGNIVVAGGLIYSGALMQAVNFGVHGIITGGINAVDFKAVAGGRIEKRHRVGTDIGLSLLVTEGFGSIPIGEDIYNLLNSHQGEFAILDGNRARLILPATESSCMIRIRKTQLPSENVKSLEGINEPEALEVEEGFKVRVVSVPYLGEQGMVAEIDKLPTKLDSGVSTYLVTVQTRARKIRVPYTNIEVI